MLSRLLKRLRNPKRQPQPTWTERDMLVDRIAQAIGIPVSEAREFLDAEQREIDDRWVHSGGNWGDIAVSYARWKLVDKPASPIFMSNFIPALPAPPLPPVFYKTTADLMALNGGPKRRFRVAFDPSVSHSHEDWGLEGQIGELVTAYQEAVVLRIDDEQHCFMWMDVEEIR